MAQFRQRVIKHAQKNGNISETARLFRVSRQSVHRWIVRWDGTLDSLKDHSHRPKRHPSQQTKQEVDMVLRVQRHQRQDTMAKWSEVIDQERFYNDNRFHNKKYLIEKMNRYLRISNRQPLLANGWRTAQEMLNNYQHVL